MLAPGGTESAKALDMELLKTLVASPLSATVNPIFVAIFNSLGILPFVYSALLLPGAKNQNIPAWPFCLR